MRVKFRLLTTLNAPENPRPSLPPEGRTVVKVVDCCYESTGIPGFICDFSPPRSGSIAEARRADIPADFISVAYNPGRAVRANSAMLAAAIKLETGMETVFTLATRDMNRLALQSLLLGAQMLGLANVVVVQGDPFNDRDLTLTRPADDYRPTELIAGIRAMNEGVDFRGSNLREPTNFCIGATFDLGRGIDAEAALTARKVAAGADFLISQPVFDPDDTHHFRDSYERHSAAPLTVPVFYGLQILEAGGVLFSSVPESVRNQLDAGRSGVDIAAELYQRFQDAGLRNVYLMPPIRRGGARDYAAAREFLELARDN